MCAIDRGLKQKVDNLPMRRTSGRQQSAFKDCSADALCACQFHSRQLQRLFCSIAGLGACNSEEESERMLRAVQLKQAAICVQKMQRGRSVRKVVAQQAAAATMVQKCWHGWMQRRAYLRMQAAAVKLQAAVRCWQLRGRFLAVRQAAITTQVMTMCQPRCAKLHDTCAACGMLLISWPGVCTMHNNVMLQLCRHGNTALLQVLVKYRPSLPIESIFNASLFCTRFFMYLDVSPILMSTGLCCSSFPGF